ncbi:hypothetical protein Tco_1194822 [Tanacetum coccineum]
MYVTASRLDIMFAVCVCSRFQVTPKTSHLSAVKRIFRYLKGKPKLGLWYPRESSFDLESYSDSDYAGANLDRKSTTGGCQFSLAEDLSTCNVIKQTIVATSTNRSEYVAAASCCEPTGENLGDHSSSDTSFSGIEDDMTLLNCLCILISEKPHCNRDSQRKASPRNKGCTKSMYPNKGGRKQKENHQFKEILCLKYWLKIKFDQRCFKLKGGQEIWWMKRRNLMEQDLVLKMKPNVSTVESKVSTDDQVESTDESKESTEEIFEGSEDQREGTEDKVSSDEKMEGTKDQSKEENASKASQTSTHTPTSMTFGDDETIATLLLNMSKAKAASKEKEKGVELKDVEDIDRPRPTSTRSLLTLKPLPKIDPKDKGKKKIEEEEESESEDDDIPQVVLGVEEEEAGIAGETALLKALIKEIDDILYCKELRQD